MIINRFNLKLSFSINYYTHDMGKFFWVGLKINNPTRIMDISRNPTKNVGIAKALLKLWILSNVHKACVVILSRLLYIHYAMRSTHTCYAILTWIKEFTYLDKNRIIRYGDCPQILTCCTAA